MSNRPLRDLTVLELGQFLAAPYAAEVLGDLGARVIKVEPPEGDGVRGWGPHPGGESAPYMAYNRGKESVVADIRSASGQEFVRKLFAVADVVIENNRPGVLARYGLDAAVARQCNPRLVFCSISGYGANAPDANRPAFDLIVQGMTGMMDLVGAAGQSIAKVPVPIVDGTAALHATTAILAALRERENTGQGATIDISLHASSMSWMMLLAAGYFANGEEPRRLGSAHPLAAPYQAFEALDGGVTIAAGNDRQWARLCEVFGLDGAAVDPRFCDNAGRAEHQAELAALVQEKVGQRPRAEIIALLGDAGIPCGPIYRLSEAVEDPTLTQRGDDRQLRSSLRRARPHDRKPDLTRR